MEGSTIDSLGSATKDIFTTTKVWENFWIAVIGVVAAGLVGLVLYLMKKGGVSSFQFLRDRVQTPRALRSYREGLEKATLALTHSWKLEGQSLERLIVPLHLEVGQHEKAGLEQWVTEAFAKAGEVPRLVMLGEAGSGKSVAMGTIARVLWEVNVAKPRVPVLLTFKEIQFVRDEQTLADVVVRKLKQFQYDRGREGAALKFVEGNLNSGGIVLLLDGLDELEKQTRLDVAWFLRQFFTTYHEVPFVVSSRVAVWNQFPSILGDLAFLKYTLAPFTPLEVKIFVSRWEFLGEKSADQLSALIVSKPYLLNMAENPLILTIICFLYAQPKRVLPDHRVKFYSECVDALMEKWDNAKNVDRANKFETVDKVVMLSEVAYRHLVKNEKGGEDIHRDEVLDAFADVMRKMSRPVENRQMVLDEIVQKAELLVEMPPDQFKFPHRTFLEYFAALYFCKNHLHSELLDLYDADPGKWQETLLLFCGMNENLDVSDLVFGRLMNRYGRDSAEVMVFRALVETAMVSGGVANAVVDLAEGHLAVELNAEIVECLGYIAANPILEHSKKTREVLLGILHEGISESELLIIIPNVISFANQEENLKITDKLFRHEMASVLPRLFEIQAERAMYLVDGLGKEELLSTFRKLVDAGNTKILFDIACNSRNEAVRYYGALVLAEASKTSLFMELLKELPFEEKVRPSKRETIDLLHFHFGWPKKASRIALMSMNGQKVFFTLCDLLANGIIHDGAVDHDRLENVKRSLSLEMSFLIHAIIDLMGITFSKLNFLDSKIVATRKGLVLQWRNREVGTGSILTGFLALFLIFTEPNYLLWILNHDSFLDNKTSFIALLATNCLLVIIILSSAAGKYIGSSIGKKILLSSSLLSPGWAFIAMNEKDSIIHWFGGISPKKWIFVLLSNVTFLGIHYWFYGPTWIMIVFASLSAIFTIAIVLSSYLNRFSKTFTNEKIRAALEGEKISLNLVYLLLVGVVFIALSKALTKSKKQIPPHLNI